MKGIIDKLQILTLRRPTALQFVASVLDGLLTAKENDGEQGKPRTRT
jgi:hypothetical protein